MYAIETLEKKKDFPPQKIKIADKQQIVWSRDWLQPCVKGEQPTKSSDALAQWRDKAWDEDKLSTVFELIKKIIEILF